jgi:hypothetical protein
MKKSLKLIIVIICILGFNLLCFKEIFQNETTQVGQLKTEVPVGEIQKGTTVVQTFVAKEQKISAIEICFGTYIRVNNGIVTVTLENLQSKQRYVIGTILANTIKDGQFRRFSLPSMAPLKNAHMKLLIKTNSSPGHSVTVWSSKTPQFLDGKLFINGVPQPGTLAMKLKSKGNVWDEIGQIYSSHANEIHLLFSFLLVSLEMSLYLFLKSFFLK